MILWQVVAMTSAGEFDPADPAGPAVPVGRLARTATALTVALILALVAACSTEAREPSSVTQSDFRDRLERAGDVADDPGATADDVIDHGQVDGVVVDGTGRLLVTHRAAADGGEGPEAVAWQLLEPSGRETARGIVSRSEETTAGADIGARDDGFAWVLFEQDLETVTTLDPSGATHRVTVERRSGPRAGDLLLAGFTEAPVLLRGEEAFGLKRSLVPSTTPWLGLDRAGTLWGLSEGLTLQRSILGRPFANVGPPPAHPFDIQSIAVRDGSVASVLLRASQGNMDIPTDVVVRPPGGGWRSVGLAGVRRRSSLSGLEILRDGGLVLGGRSAPTYHLEAGQRRWQPVLPPGGNSDGWVVRCGDRWCGVADSWSELEVSDDGLEWIPLG